MESIKELRKICQDKGFQEHIALRFHRIFSIYITRVFLILKIRPNVVTILGFLMGITGGYLFLNSYFLQGSVFFLFLLIFDYVDGEIARYRKLSSNFGAWLDTMSVHLLYPYFFFTLGLGIFFQTGIFWYIVLGALAAMAKLIERSMIQPLIKDSNLRFLKNQTITSAKEWVNHIAKISVQCPIIFLCSLVGWEEWFLWFFAIYLTLFTSGKVFLTGWRTYKQKKYYKNTK